MKTYVLLHFEHKNGVTIIIKLCMELRATCESNSLKFDNDCDVILCSKCNRTYLLCFHGIIVL